MTDGNPCEAGDVCVFERDGEQAMAESWTALCTARGIEVEG